MAFCLALRFPACRPALILGLALVVLAGWMNLTPGMALAQSALAPALSPPAAVAPATPAAPPIRVIIEVPNDDAGRAFVNNQLVPKVSGANPPQVTTPDAQPAQAAQPVSAPIKTTMEMTTMAGQGLDSLRERASSLVMAAPNVPEAVAGAFRIFERMGNRLRLPWLVGAFVLFAAGGFLARRLAWWSARGLLAKILEAPGETAAQRVRLLGMRLSIAIYVLFAFVVGSLGAFLLFPWPPVFREMVLSLLGITLTLGVFNAIGRLLIAPGARHDYFRVLPLSTRLAVFWYRWMMAIVAVFAIGGGVLSLLAIIGVSSTARDVIGMAWLAVVAGMLITVIWQRQTMEDEEPISRVVAVVLTMACIFGWIFAAMQLKALFWTLVVFILVPMLMDRVREGVRNVVRLDDPNQPKDAGVITWAVLVERALRALIVIVGAYVLADVWGVDLGDIAMGETAFTRALRALVRIVIVLLVADVSWRLIRAVIDGRLDDEPAAVAHDDSPEARKRQRLRTLLPILRNFLIVLICAVTVLMVMDSMGIQIGPLLAGAGVVGIAIGFGAQTLVKDIISGVFYLLDDAFRVGEYIQTGSHKGTVESFSLRSIKLRHHRGPIATVPFGELGAVQNMSRDWVIDKITVGVPYDTDLEKVRKLVKKIGQQLMDDPEMGQHILEPLKMQGVEQMGDYAIQIRLKIMTRPGEQFVIRRKAYALLKKAFEDNDIHFAFPTVRVSGGEKGDSAAAAAQTAIELHKPQTTAAQ